MTKDARTKMDWRSIVLDVAAVICFLATMWLALTDKASAATVTGALTFGLTALRFLPLIDTLEAFGIKAKLRQTLNEADGVLANLRAASRLAYFQLAFLGRMASPTWLEKRSLSEEMDATLLKLGHSADEISILRQPVVRFLLADLYHLFAAVVGARISKLRRPLDHKLHNFAPRQDNEAERQALEAEVRKLRVPSTVENILADRRLETLTAFMTEELLATGLPKEDIDRLRPLATRLGEIGEAAWARRAITDAAFELVQSDTGGPDWVGQYRAVFGEDPR